ncbi:MAG: hypothetical protein HWN65_10745, partial [Candidatus Helarchaeota archaeon]|nr:hypothetical protein [Candidatus Helarchaeota archaeon]
MRLHFLRKHKSVFLLLLSFMFITILFTLVIGLNGTPNNNSYINDGWIESRQTYTATVYTNASAYQSDMWVEMTVYFEDDMGSPVVNGLVSFQIDDNTSTTVHFDTSLTDGSGWATNTYHLPSPATEGTWCVYISADDQGTPPEMA